jgi:hypothetical protein
VLRRPPRLKLIPGPKDAYGNSFGAIAVCGCGHEAQLPHEWVKLAAMYGHELEQAKARLRCSECGGGSRAWRSIAWATPNALGQALGVDVNASQTVFWP